MGVSIIVMGVPPKNDGFSNRKCHENMDDWGYPMTQIQETICGEPLLRAAGHPGPLVEVAAGTANNLRLFGGLGLMSLFGCLFWLNISKTNICSKIDIPFLVISFKYLFKN